ALKIVPRERAFYFFTSIGNYTGESAASLKEFLGKIREVSLQSLEFHLYRGDFDRWIAEVLQDEELANEVKRLQKSGLSGDELRNQLHMIVARHLASLAETSP
ncbi:MAG: DUF5752 family protein, partial [Candidatus Bathyarchaeia archaeon]